MLRALDIRDMLLIDRLELGFGAGLNVLTGETGAGKSILLDCLGFVLGWRGRADLVRAGAAQGEAQAVFDLSAGHPAHAVLAEAGLPAGEELILRRTVQPDGRKTGYVNDRRVGGETLRALSETLVELHGQGDDRGLLNPRGHRTLLDAYAATEAEIGAVRLAWRALSEARAARAAAEARLASLRAEEDFLRHAVAELDRLDPQPGEEAALDVRRREMQAAERVRGDIVQALAALSENGAEGALRDAVRRLDAAAAAVGGRLDPAIAALDQTLAGLSDAQAAVEACLEGIDHDPGALETAEERLFAIRALARKHGVLADDLSGFADDLRARLAALDAGDGDLADLTRAEAVATDAHLAACAALTARRTEAAGRLDAAMAAELPPLRLDRAVFSTRIEPVEPGPEGADSVAFQAATNPGLPAGPLDKVASGGELSRFLLALKVCLSRESPGVTLIFDEIDRGVGGATADAVGRRLARIAAGAQVLVVTHSPQVAARAGIHFRVEKRVTGETTLSHVSALDAARRVDEIARMLAGDTITPEARAAAQALLAP